MFGQNQLSADNWIGNCFLSAKTAKNVDALQHGTLAMTVGVAIHFKEWVLYFTFSECRR